MRGGGKRERRPEEREKSDGLLVEGKNSGYDGLIEGKIRKSPLRPACFDDSLLADGVLRKAAAHQARKERSHSC